MSTDMQGGELPLNQPFENTSLDNITLTKKEYEDFLLIRRKTEELADLLSNLYGSRLTAGGSALKMNVKTDWRERRYDPFADIILSLSAKVSLEVLASLNEIAEKGGMKYDDNRGYDCYESCHPDSWSDSTVRNCKDHEHRSKGIQ